MKTIHFRDSNGNYIGGFAGAEPPEGAIECTAPPHGLAIWVDDKWVMPDPPREHQQTNRAAAYRNEADPLFFKYQRGEATEQEWLDKIEEIRARYPYPEE